MYELGCYRGLLARDTADNYIKKQRWTKEHVVCDNTCVDVSGFPENEALFVEDIDQWGSSDAYVSSYDPLLVLRDPSEKLPKFESMAKTDREVADAFEALIKDGPAREHFVLALTMRAMGEAMRSAFIFIGPPGTNSSFEPVQTRQNPTQLDSNTHLHISGNDLDLGLCLWWSKFGSLGMSDRNVPA
eukprot:4506748-Prymnesium_polylepis.1